MHARIAACVVLGVMTSFGTAVRAVPNDRPRPEQDRHAKTEAAEKLDPSSTHFYLGGDVGYGAVDLDSFRAANNGSSFTAGLVPTRAGGPSADLGLGFRLSTLTLGLRAALIALQDESAERNVGSLQLWSLDGEIGFHVPIGRVEPQFLLAGGYSKFGGLGDAIAGVQRGLDIDGANARIGLGLDYFATRQVSIGAHATAELLFLSRSSIPLRDLTAMERVGTISEAKARALQADGTTVGAAYTILIGPGLHF